jgi:hypothetical protein
MTQYEAFTLCTVATKLPLEVTAIANHGESTLYAATATKNGLLIYKPSSEGVADYISTTSRGSFRS